MKHKKLLTNMHFTSSQSLKCAHFAQFDGIVDPFKFVVVIFGRNPPCNISGHKLSPISLTTGCPPTSYRTLLLNSGPSTSEAKPGLALFSPGGGVRRLASGGVTLSSSAAKQHRELKFVMSITLRGQMKIPVEFFS